MMNVLYFSPLILPLAPISRVNNSKLIVITAGPSTARTPFTITSTLLTSSVVVAEKCGVVRHGNSRLIELRVETALNHLNLLK